MLDGTQPMFDVDVSDPVGGDVMLAILSAEEIAESFPAFWPLLDTYWSEGSAFSASLIYGPADAMKQITVTARRRRA